MGRFFGQTTIPEVPYSHFYTLWQSKKENGENAQKLAHVCLALTNLPINLGSAGEVKKRPSLLKRYGLGTAFEQPFQLGISSSPQ